MSIRFFRKPTIACAEKGQISSRRLSNSRFSSIWRNLRKILQFFLIAMRAVLWLFFGPSKRRFAKFRARFKYGGLRACWCHAIERFSKLSTQYNLLYNQLSSLQSKFLLSKYDNSPLISVIVLVYKNDLKWLKRCVESVINQYYTNWEAIIVDVSGKPEIENSMNLLASKDSRVYAYFLKENYDIAAATNFGIKQARGDFIGFLGCNDELTPDALVWIVWALAENPNALWLYSDEDLVSHNGRCRIPRFKPDFSLELLLSNMYTHHFSVYSTRILNKAAGFRKEFDGALEHDLALRLSEIVPKEKIVHIPRVLYHGRAMRGSAAMDNGTESKALLAGRKAVTEALNRRNLKGKVSSHKLCPAIYQIEFELSKFPMVSVVIPTKNALVLTRRCINSLRKYTDYPNLEIVVINNASDDRDMLGYLAKEKSENKIKVLHYNKPFNHSEMNNIAATSVGSEYIVFMNNDIEIISEKWLEQLVAVTELDESIAAVGCLLLYEDSTVQHGGIILGINNIAGHAHKYIDSNEPGYFGRLQALQEYSGVTAALSVTRKSAFIDVGGFNSTRYPTSFNDVDLCIRLQQRGYRCIYNPMVRAIHHESKTRPITKDEFVFRQRLFEDHCDILLRDPFYNPNLTLYNEQLRGFRPFPIEEQIPELANMP